MASHKTIILEMLKSAPNQTISCRQLSYTFLFHKAASRISELRKEGYDIEYIPGQTDSVLDAHYRLKGRQFYQQQDMNLESSEIESSFGPR